MEVDRSVGGVLGEVRGGVAESKGAHGVLLGVKVLVWGRDVQTPTTEKSFAYFAEA
jgi:hypothetical protein